MHGHVRFDHVSFGYDAISPVLRDVTIEAKAGEIVALLGQTGSGKTTVVNLMPRFYDVTGGAITIDGIDIRDATLTSLRRAFGIVQQDVFLFSATIGDNIAYGASGATEEDVVRVAKLARIHDFIQTLPDGYNTWVGERGVTLSGGQKQRVSIARTLLLDPKILVFDDSTSSVDTQTEYDIQQALAELMKGRTTFVIAQRLRTVRSADQILVLKDGQIVEHGRHEELIAQDGLYRQIYDLELRDQEEAFERGAPAPGSDGTRPGRRGEHGCGGGRELAMAYWGGGGGAGGWSGGGGGGPGGNWANNLRPNSLQRSVDGWNDDELGSVYNHRVVVRLGAYLKPYRVRLALALIGTLGAAAATRLTPLAVKGLIDAAAAQDLANINRWGMTYLVMAGLAAIFMFVQLTSSGWMGHRLLLHLRQEMFAHLQKLSLRFYDNNEVGRVMSRVTSDVTSLQELMTSGFLTILGDIVGVGISIGVLHVSRPTALARHVHA